ncbi:MAG: hypothetical protein HUJ26_03380 [Planctomycetaceae bacterium]|nr:hypothetical protein [Planctomycetaceae bacterium]
MAHVVLTIEPDPTIRRTFLLQATSVLESDSELEVHSAEVGELAVVWAHGAHVPVGFIQDSQDFCLLLGYAIDDQERHLDENILQREWTKETVNQPGWSGYFAAVRYSETTGLAVDVDLLGYFPMYVYHRDGVLIAGSSGALFESHPLFRSELDPLGLAGILLTNGLVNERTLFKDVRQLSAGCRLFRSPAGLVSDLRTWELEVASDESISFEETVSSVDEELIAAIQRHRPPNESTTLMLSGGLDSRLMAGYLDRVGMNFSATTFGRSIDFEVRGARQVTRLLEIPHTEITTEGSEEEIVRTASRIAHLDHLTHGFSGIQGERASIGSTSPMFWSGHFLDDLLGGYAAGFAIDPETHQLSFETFFRKLNRWGMAPKTLSRLIQPSFDDSDEAVASVIESFRATWNGYTGSDAQKSFQLKLATRARYHLAGSLHRLSFDTWPITPHLDRRLLNRMIRVPLEFSLRRRLENRLLSSSFPELDALPLDTNSFRFENSSGLKARHPLHPRKLWVSAQKSLRSWYWLHWRRTEPRRYHRVFDPDQRDWKIIRAAAEPHRQELSTWLDDRELRKVLPSPEVNLGYADPFADGAAFRNLCGLMLWKAGSVSELHRAA